MTEAPATTTVYEIRTREHGETAWTTLEEHPAGYEPARDLAAFKGLRQEDPLLAEVLLIGEWGPVARWLNGQEVRPESLTPGHPGGCSCGECCLRWAHLENQPGHEPCNHGVCLICKTCEVCYWDEVQDRLQASAADAMTDAGDAACTALMSAHTARNRLSQLRNEIHSTEMDVDSVDTGDLAAALAKLDRAAEALEDVARITENYQLRARLAELGESHG